jgi:SET domain-containing protein
VKIQYNRFYYKPLPDKVCIKESPIDGHGIFAAQDIKKGVDLGSTHIKVPMILTYIRTPLGGFINHSDEPNCFLDCTQDWDDYLVFNIITKRSIAKGEELLLNYET